MTVTDEQVAVMRAYLSAQTYEQADRARQLYSHFVETETAEGLGELIYAAFVNAAHRKFSPTWTPAAVVQYVAEVRAQAAGEPDFLSPGAAENQLRAALGQDVPSYPDETSRTVAQAILLTALVRDLGLDQAGLDDLLAQARSVADQLINRKPLREESA